MKTVVMASYDKKARVFMKPFFVSHQDVGVRAFKDAVNDQATEIGRNPEDFTLYRLGTFDDDNAKFDLSDKPEVICEALQLKKASVL